MKIYGLLALLPAAVLCFGNSASADMGDPARPTIHFDDLQIGLVSALQQRSLLRTGGLIRYLPEYVFDRDAGDHFWGVGLDLGVSVFSERADQAMFLVGEPGAYAAYHLNASWDFRFFSGAQIWGNSNGSAAFVGPDVIYHFDARNRYFCVDGLFASYKAVLHSRFVNYMSAGINFKLN